MKQFFLHLLISSSFLVACSQSTNKINTPAETNDGIKAGLLANEGFDSALIKTMEEKIQKGDYPNIHSLLICRNNKLVFEKYWPGEDQSWGTNLGKINHNKDSLHDIRSISKSIVSACIGIAVQQGKIKTVDQKVFEFFPEYAKLDTGLKSALTIKHLLTMSSGLAWNEDVPYDNPENSEIKMINSPNQVEFVLSQPLDFPPGQVWKYNGGNTQLLAAIIQKTTGKKVDQFANEFLFQPLGITSFEWIKYPGTDLPAAASGLRLRSRDLLKFGLLYANKGSWKGKQLIPEKWVEESFLSHVKRSPSGEEAYGYQFWISTENIKNKPSKMVFCVGNGDQRIFLDNGNHLIIVITAGNYNKWNIAKNSTAILKEYIYPSLRN